MLYSHPDKLLFDHLNDVKDSTLNLLDSKNISIPEQILIIYSLSLQIIRNIVFYSSIFHDFGKATTFFQEHLLMNKPSNKLSEQSKLLGIVCYHFFL